MTARRALPSALDSPFTRRAARAAGVPDSRLRAADLARPFRGVRAPVDVPATLQSLCAAYLLRMTPGQAFSHETAARLYGLPLPAYIGGTSPLHVSVLTGSRPPEARGIRGHELSPGRWRTQGILLNDPLNSLLAELPVLSPALVFAQLAAVMDPDDLVALGDAIVGGESPLSSVRDLAWISSHWTGRRGARKLVGAVPQVRVGALSRPESLHRMLLVRAGIPEPRLNVVVEDRLGRPIAMADEVWEGYRTLVEYEGELHRTSRGKFRSDITRFERYADGEWAALRAHAGDVFDDPNPFIGRLWRRLESRGWGPPSREPRKVAGARR